jgi:hypothetical protein
MAHRSKGIMLTSLLSVAALAASAGMAMAQQTTTGDPCGVYPKLTAVFAAGTTSASLVTGVSAHAIHICGYQVVLSTGTAGVAAGYISASTTSACSGPIQESVAFLAGVNTTVTPYTISPSGSSVAVIPQGDYACYTVTSTAISQDAAIQYVIY